MTEPQTAEVALPSQGLARMLEPYRDRFEVDGPADQPVDLFMAQAFTYLEQRPELAKCRPETVLVALLDCRRFGAILGTEYHIVPFKGMATGIADYKLEIRLMANAGWITNAAIVYEDDIFSISGGRAHHERDVKASGGKAIGVYAYAVKDGQYSQVVYLDADQVGRHLALSKAQNELRATFWESWWLKAAVHELAKWVPWSAERLTCTRRSGRAPH